MAIRITPDGGSVARLVNEQLELAVSKFPVLGPALVHPSPVDHEERKEAHVALEDVLLGKAQVSPEMLGELAEMNEAPELNEEELVRQALADGGTDNEPSTPE